MKTRPPNVSPETLRTLTDGWLLGHIHSIRPHQGGSSGSAKYAIESTEGRFLLKGRPHRALSPERLQLMRSVMAICLEAQLPVPELRPQADGARHIEQDDLVWELQTWMDGKSARRGRRDAHASGIALAMFHRATRNHPFESFEWRVQSRVHVIGRAHHGAVPFQQDIPSTTRSIGGTGQEEE